MPELLLEVFFMFAYVGGGSFKKPLSAKEESLYFQRLRAGDGTARDIIIERNMRLVAHISKKYAATCNVEMDELISIGSIGLIKGVNTFDPDKGSRFATYGARCVENEILMYLRNNKKHAGLVSLQDTVGVDKEGNEVTLEERLWDDGESVEEQAQLKGDILTLRWKLNCLSERELYIISLRYGLNGEKELPQREIAARLGISRSYVSRIEKRALEKLRREME